MDINKLLNELFFILDKDENINKMNDLKKEITSQEIDLINNYRCNPTIDNKKKLYENELINEYLTCESNINYLIMEINNKFKRRGKHACNKW